MAKKLKIWYDREADFLEVMFSDEPGYVRESDEDNLLERVNQKGK
ncbi:MAG: DUF2283 domain-containing protein [Candidatus Kapabacteria bacterium]|nr:DUF2283 domain-containing protein [Candidatus Kapabacteria bacterium]